MSCGRLVMPFSGHLIIYRVERGQEARIVQIDILFLQISTVRDQGIHFKLCSVRIVLLCLSVLRQFLSNRSQYVAVDDCRCKVINAVSGVADMRV